MNICKEIQEEEANKGRLVSNWHIQELEYFISDIIKKDRTEQSFIDVGGFSNGYNKGFEDGLKHRSLKCKCGKK